MEEDPRELARRLAEEAKRRHQPGSNAEDPRELARRLAEEAKKRVQDEPVAAAPPTPTRPMTAKEALAKARAERASGNASPSLPPLPQTAAPVPMPAEERAFTEVVDLEPTMPIPGSSIVRVTRLISGLLSDATVLEQDPVLHLDVFRALWRAHLARARQDRDLPMLSLCTVLLDAAERLEPGNLVACRISAGGQEWAGWVDLERDTLLGVAKPVEVYLTSH